RLLTHLNVCCTTAKVVPFGEDICRTTAKVVPFGEDICCMIAMVVPFGEDACCMRARLTSLEEDVCCTTMGGAPGGEEASRVMICVTQVESHPKLPLCAPRRAAEMVSLCCRMAISPSREAPSIEANSVSARGVSVVRSRVDM